MGAATWTRRVDGPLLRSSTRSPSRTSASRLVFSTPRVRPVSRKARCRSSTNTSQVTPDDCPARVGEALPVPPGQPAIASIRTVVTSRVAGIVSFDGRPASTVGFWVRGGFSGIPPVLVPDPAPSGRGGNRR